MVEFLSEIRLIQFREYLKYNCIFFSAQLSIDGFELICLDGTRKPISDYLSCNWGKVPSDTVVVSSAVSAVDRLKYQKFLQLFSDRYGKHNGTFNQVLRTNQFYGNQVQPEYDQFGNLRNNRFKRQNFDSSNARAAYDKDSYNPYTNQNQNQDDSNERLSVVGYNNYDQNNQPDDKKYNRYSNDNNYNPYNNNPYRTNENNNNDPFAQDPFARDPYAINRDQYGVNIDPYDTDVRYRTSNDPLFGSNNNTYGPNNEGGIFQNNGTNVTYYEEFHLFQSIPRYGWHGNLMFQVLICENVSELIH